MFFSNSYTTPSTIDGIIVEFFESGFNGVTDAWVGNTVLVVLSILVACFFSSLIGYQRERNGHPAGFRTHVLIGLGSALIMLISIYAAPGNYETRDPLRLAAAGVTGIGFLGAGAIIQNGFSIRGLTSAASIWVTMAIGMCAGCGYFFIGTLSTIITLVILALLHKVEFRATSKSAMILLVTKVEDNALEDLVTIMEEMNLKISDISTSRVKKGEETYLRTVFRASGSKKGITEELLKILVEKLDPIECEILH